jgi:hypothetical protein
LKFADPATSLRLPLQPVADAKQQRHGWIAGRGRQPVFGSGAGPTVSGSLQRRGVPQTGFVLSG